MPILRTVAGRSRWEIPKIRGSRFLAEAAAVADEDRLARWLDGIREEFPGATHHCWAAVLGSGTEPEPVVRSSDDGEPSGTAGRPILREIRGRELVRAGVVVVRWFGGTKLGTGGLVRAYSAAASEVLDRARIVERPLTRRLRVRHAYDATGPIEGVLAARGLEPAATEYGADVRLELEVPVEDLDAVEEELREATAGSVELKRGEEA